MRPAGASGSEASVLSESYSGVAFAFGFGIALETAGFSEGEAKVLDGNIDARIGPFFCFGDE